MSLLLSAGADASVVKRTQAALAAHKEPPVAYAAYLTIATYWNVLLMYFFAAAVQLLCARSWGRKLLLRYPGLFSNGCVPHRSRKAFPADMTRVWRYNELCRAWLLGDACLRWHFWSVD